MFCGRHWQNRHKPDNLEDSVGGYSITSSARARIDWGIVVLGWVHGLQPALRHGSEPANKLARRAREMPRKARSTALFDGQMRPPILGLFAPLPGAKFSQEGGLIGAPMPMVSARDLHPDPRNSKPLTKPTDQLTREPNAVPTNRATH